MIHPDMAGKFCSTGEQFIIPYTARTFMTIRKARRKNSDKPFHELVTDLLFSAMANHEDFVLTYEINPATKKKGNSCHGRETAEPRYACDPQK